MTSTTVVVIGGGIAGASAAHALANHRRRPDVTLIEAEGQLAHHTTGRSAAQFIENYGTGPTRLLTRASRSYFVSPPNGLVDGELLTPRGLLTVAAADQAESFRTMLDEGLALNASITEISVAEAQAMFPPLRTEQFERALLEPDSADIDVAALHQSFVRGLTAAGGTVATSRRALALERTPSGWRIETSSGDLSADLVVNAAGAWGDDVANRAGMAPIGLRPLRRTAFMVTGQPENGSAEWPLVADVDHRWYLKPDGVQLLCSPADETPSEPCDAKPEEIDIARAIDLINDATTLGIRSVRSSWAGLRTFTPDRTMALGPDPAEPTFVWCVGQGGTGIQTAPAAGELVARLALDGSPGNLFDDVGLEADLEADLAAFQPGRFRPGAP